MDILLLGDQERATYHPAAPVLKAAERCFPGARVTLCTAYEALGLPDFQRPDLIIQYADEWGKMDTRHTAQALKEAVFSGARLLVLHGGIITHGEETLVPLYGGTFTHHPDRQVVRFVPSGNHPASQGIPAFELYEEPYMLSLDSCLPKTPILTMVYEGKDYPAGWAIQYGQGRMAYLAPGHDAQTFESEDYLHLIQKTAAWCIA